MDGGFGAALVAITTAGSTESAARAGGALVAVAVAALATSFVAPAPVVLRHAAAGGVAAAVGVSVARLLAATWPGLTPVLVPATAAGLAVVALALPARVRRGPAVAALVAAGLAALVPFAGSLAGGVWTAARAFPAWHAPLAAVEPLYDWQRPAGLVLAAVAVAAALPRRG